MVKISVGSRTLLGRKKVAGESANHNLILSIRHGGEKVQQRLGCVLPAGPPLVCTRMAWF